MFSVIFCLSTILTAVLSMPADDEDKRERWEALERQMDNDIRRHKVMLYSKTYCYYSQGIKQILAKYDVDDMKVVELDLEPEMSRMQDHLRDRSGVRTVPQLFIDGKFIGGYELTSAKDEQGDLEKALERAGAVARVPKSVDEYPYPYSYSYSYP